MGLYMTPLSTRSLSEHNRHHGIVPSFLVIFLNKNLPVSLVLLVDHYHLLENRLGLCESLNVEDATHLNHSSPAASRLQTALPSASHLLTFLLELSTSPLLHISDHLETVSIHPYIEPSLKPHWRSHSKDPNQFTVHIVSQQLLTFLLCLLSLCPYWLLSIDIPWVPSPPGFQNNLHCLHTQDVAAFPTLCHKSVNQVLIVYLY